MIRPATKGRKERGARLWGASLRCAAGVSLLLASILAGCAGIPEAPVPENPTLNDQLLVAAGGFYTEISSEARLDSEFLGLGATIDLEDALDLDENKLVPFGMAHFRLDDRWRFEIEYYRLQRESTETIDIEIQWGDVTFPINTGLEAHFDIQMYRASLGYAFFRRKDKELGIALGLHAARINAELSDESGTTRDKGDLLAPLPVGSLYGGIALTDSWSILMRIDAFSLESEGYDGRLLSNGVDLIYQPFRHIGFGVGFRDLYVDLESSESDYPGKIESNVRGPIAFLTASY